MNKKKALIIALSIILVLVIILLVVLVSSNSGDSSTNTETTAPATQATTVPTELPTQPPTEAPTEEPTQAPTEAPTEEPTQAPTEAPTKAPTEPPTQAPTRKPTQKPTQAPTQKPTQKPTQAPTQKPTQKPTESDHNHDMVLRTTLVKATHDKEGLEEVRCSWCGYSIQQAIPKVDVPYLVGIELVNAQRPNECYLSDGTPILEKIFGKNYCQVGDVLTYKVIMSDGSAEGFTVKNELPMVADMEVNGNLITVTVTDQRFLNDAFDIDVISNDIDNNWKMDGIFTNIVLGDCKFTDLDGMDVKILLDQYIVNQGMEVGVFILNDFNSGKLTSYTNGDPSKSISGTAKYGYDDYIIIEEHENWLEVIFNLIDEYKARGITKVYMYYAYGAFEFKAGN